jgi:PPOX class probable F420-dependent enzyme
MPATEAIEAFLGEPRNLVLVGIRKNGSPQASPNWFSWDGENFYVSTTKRRAKYPIFKRDPRAELLIDDLESRRYLALSATVEVREDLAAVLAIFRRTREKYGVPVPSDEEFLSSLQSEERVLLVITPDTPTEAWRSFGFT